MRILSRKTKNNPVLIGEPGVGKTAVVEALATAMLAQGERLQTLRDRVIIELDVGSRHARYFPFRRAAPP